MFYLITQHQYDSEDDTSPSPCFCLGGAMMFLLNSANIETAVTDTFVGVLPRLVTRGSDQAESWGAVAGILMW